MLRKIVYIIFILQPLSSAQDSSDIGRNLLSMFEELLKFKIPEDVDGKQSYRPGYSPRPTLPSNILNSLSTVVKYDELECVPRLLCEAAAGGKPGSSRQFNIDQQSLQALLSFMNLDPAGSSSPMLVFGKAALLGLTNRGDPYSCIQSYPKCPRDQDRLLYYLNNHRGGIFRLFDMKLEQNGETNGNYGQGNLHHQRPQGNYQLQPGIYNRPQGNFQLQQGVYNRPQGNYPFQQGNFPLYPNYHDSNGLHFNLYPNRFKKYFSPTKYSRLYKNAKPEIYAKKYTHSAMFKDGGNVVFPPVNDGAGVEARIQTKPNNLFVYSDNNLFAASVRQPNPVKFEILNRPAVRDQRKTLKFEESSANLIVNKNEGKIQGMDRLPSNAQNFFPTREEKKTFFPQ